MTEVVGKPLSLEPNYLPNEGCKVSDVFYQRMRELGHHIAGRLHLTSAADRQAFIRTLEAGGDKLCASISLPYVKTKDVHDVTSGSAPAGDFFFCDMLADLFHFEPGKKVLDFGCSTGRVIRNLKAAIPGIDAYGCDPRQSSIDFIRPLVPEVTWFTSNQAPPITDEAVPRFDLIFAISVWSHFSEERARAWFTEMGKLVQEGGELIFSTHGLRSIYHFNKVKKSMPDARALERQLAFAEGKLHFMPYGNTDLDRHWGMAFIPEKWIKRNLSKDWVLIGHHEGLAMANQDVYVLRRKTETL